MLRLKRLFFVFFFCLSGHSYSMLDIRVECFLRKMQSTFESEVESIKSFFDAYSEEEKNAMKQYLLCGKGEAVFSPEVRSILDLYKEYYSQNFIETILSQI